MAEIVDIDELDITRRYVVTFGNYDGYHLGHQHCIDRLCEKSRNLKLDSILITFNPHTLMVINPDVDNFIITDNISKCELIKNTDVNYIVNLEFNQNLKMMTREKFLDLLIKKTNPKCLIFGYDAKFGSGQKGNIDFAKDFLKNSDIIVEQLSKVKSKRNVEVKSSFIRDCILKSRIQDANIALGRNFEITGLVVRGNEIGRELGFPTANVKISDKYKIVPGNGVYSTIVKFDNYKYKALTNIGFRPTFSNSLSNKNIESYLITDHNVNLYDKVITIEFLQFIRNEMKFDNKELLAKQIKKDLLSVTKMR